MEEIKITIEDVRNEFKDSPALLNEFLAQTKLPKDIAELLFTAYSIGVDKYFNKYYDEKFLREKTEARLNNLALGVAEKWIKQ